jgi:hypothetical protein
MFVNWQDHREGRLVIYKLVPIGDMRPGQRCKRADCISPPPTIRFHVDGGRIAVAWSWVGIDLYHTPNRLRIGIQLRLLLIRMSCN